MDKYDISIIGGGIIGLAVAYRLAQDHPDLRLAVLEKEVELARHQTGHNSGVIHSGIYYRPGSVKALTCVKGRQALLEFCDRHGIHYDLRGKVIVATSEDDLPRLEELHRKAQANGVPGIEMIGPERLREIEPHCRGLRALHVPGTGIIDFTHVAEQYAALFRAAGGAVLTSCEVKGIRHTSGCFVIETSNNPLETRFIINSAGLFVDRVAAMTPGFDPRHPPGLAEAVRIIPFRGEYHRIKEEKHYLVKGLIYPVPDPRFPFLGVHYTPTVHGHLEVGPNAVLAFAREGYRQTDVKLQDLCGIFSFKGFWAMARKYWKTSLPELRRSFDKRAFTRALQQLVPEIEADDLVYSGAGVRAQAVSASGALIDDFLIAHSGRAVHVLNAPSPGATSSLGIAEKVGEIAAKEFGL